MISPTRRRHRITAGLLLVLMVAAVLSTVVFPTFGLTERAAIWGLVLLVSFAGWGRLVAHLAFPDRRADLGLRLSWGMAALIAVGGVATLASLATYTALLVLVLGGTALEILGLLRGDEPRVGAGARRPVGTKVALLLVTILVAVQYYGGVSSSRVTIDDYQSYLVYPQKILATGTLIEPFSLRRMAAYGGQSLLHAFTLIGCGSVLQLSMFDMGICLVIVVALIIGERSRERVGFWLLPVLLVLTLPDLRANLTSLMSGVVLFLCLFRTVDATGTEAPSWRAGAGLGMLAAAAATLRHSYIIPAIAFIAFLYTPDALRAVRLPPAARWKRLAQIGVVPATMLLILLPWALLSCRSSGTPLYPLISGNYQAESSQLSSANPYVGRWAFFWLNVIHCHPIRTIPLFFLAAMLLPWRATRGSLPSLAAASALGFFAIAWGFPRSDVVSVSRYYFALVVSTAVAASMHISSLRWTDWRRDPFHTGGPAVIVLAAVVLQVHALGAQGYDGYLKMVARIRTVTQRPQLLRGDNPAYRALQKRVPDGAQLLVMLDEPFRLDFGRNPIDVIDLPGQVSPPPGMPLEDDEALVSYLRMHGFRYLAFVTSRGSRTGQYRREGWRRLAGPPPSPLFGSTAARAVEVLDRFESLRSSRLRLYDDGLLVLLDLAGRADGTSTDWF